LLHGRIKLYPPLKTKTEEKTIKVKKEATVRVKREKKRLSVGDFKPN